MWQGGRCMASIDRNFRLLSLTPASSRSNMSMPPFPASSPTSLASLPTVPGAEIRRVWACNAMEEFALIGEALQTHRFAAVDTEFPGIISESSVHYSQLSSEESYKLIKSNVDALRLIQVGLTLTDANGNLPVHRSTGRPCIWEFNFRDFDPRVHDHNPRSISFLKSKGIDFDLNRAVGIDSATFRRLFLRTGLLSNPSVTWVTFHGAYDIAYLIKILLNADLPEGLGDFMVLVRMLFGPNMYDVKHMMRHCKDLYGGLEKLAATLRVHRRAGDSHQAGSDSLLTLDVFMNMRFHHVTEQVQTISAGVLHGLELMR